jgi:hypothetical protein
MTEINRLTAGAMAITIARGLTGRPYVWGGTWPTSGGTDCSGLWQYAYGKLGIILARSTFGQFRQFPIPNSFPNEPGDLLFSHLGEGGPPGEPGHVVGFVSHGEVFQAEFTGGPPIGQFPYDTTKWDFRTRPALALPLPRGPRTKVPSALQLSQSMLILLSNPVKARLALANGWTLYIWDGWGFTGTPSQVPKGTQQFANFDYAQKRPK